MLCLLYPPLILLFMRTLTSIGLSIASPLDLSTEIGLAGNASQALDNWRPTAPVHVENPHFSRVP